MRVKKTNSVFDKNVGYFRDLKNENIFNQLIYSGPAFSTSSVLLKKKIFNEINNFDEDDNKITWEDFDAWIRFSKKTDNFGCINKVLGQITIGRDNTLKENNQIKNILSFKETYLKNEQSLPIWCLTALLTLFFKQNNFKKFSEIYNKINFKKINFKIFLKIKFLNLLLNFRYRLRKFSF